MIGLDVAEVDYGLRVAETLRLEIERNALLMLQQGHAPAERCVLVVPAKGQPGVGAPPEGQEYFMAVHTPRAALAEEFARRGHSEIAESVRTIALRPGRFLLVVTWARGTQIYQPDLPGPTSKGGAA